MRRLRRMNRVEAEKAKAMLSMKMVQLMIFSTCVLNRSVRTIVAQKAVRDQMMTSWRAVLFPKTAGNRPSPLMANMTRGLLMIDTLT